MHYLKMSCILFIIIIKALFLSGRCANILGIFPAPGYSQFILAEALMKELANRRHQITVISPYSPKTVIDNYKTILTDDVIGSGSGFDLFGLNSENLFNNILATYEFGNLLTEGTLKNKNVQELLHSSENFDLVIVEQFFDEALKGFAAHFDAPLVLFCSQGSTEWNRHFMGIPPMPTLNAVSYTSYTNTMDFFQRFRNLLGTIFDYYYRNYVHFPIQKEFYERYFPKPGDFHEIIHNVSLMLLNSHVTATQNELLPYNAIEIGGFHISSHPLDGELQNLLDSADDGVILFSLGTNLKSSDLSKPIQDAFFKVFGRLKQKVIWKFEKDITNKPPNVWIRKWLNQSDILSHPNVQLFITHGGLLSTTEAIFYGVPMLGIPIFADQRVNMARACENGIAEVIPFGELSEETLATVVDEILGDSKYPENTRRLSNIMRDRIVRPLDLAMYWIDYVIRYKGLYFKTAATHLTWFQIYMLDIFLFILLVLFLIYNLSKYLLVSIKRDSSSRAVQRHGTNKRSKQKKQ